MDISKLIEKLGDAADGGVSRKMARLEGHSALAIHTRYMERHWSTLRSVDEAMRINSFTIGGRSALEEAMRVNSFAWSARSALEEAIANQRRLDRELGTSSATERMLEEAKGWRSGGAAAYAAPHSAQLIEKLARNDRAMEFAQQANAMMASMAMGASVAETAARMSAADALAKSLASAVSPFSAEMAARGLWEERLSAQMKALDGPWMLPSDPVRSMLGFAHLTRLSDSLRYSPPYSRDLNSFLREELGEAVVPDDDATPEERDEAAIDGGMRPELIAFPEGRFSEVLRAAGFQFPPPSLPIPRTVQDGNAVASFNLLHDHFVKLVETHLRCLIKERLHALCGPSWVRQRINPKVRQRWSERQEVEQAAGSPIFDLIFYSDFMDLLDVICQQDNWRDVFASVFVSKAEISVSLQRLHPIRRACAHGRPLAKSQEVHLLSESTRVLGALGIRLLS